MRSFNDEHNDRSSAAAIRPLGLGAFLGSLSALLRGTLASWIKTNGTPSNSDGLFHSREGYDLNLYNGFPRLYIGSDAVTSIAPVNSGVWTHIAVARSGKDLAIYVNGLKTGSGAWEAGTFTVDGVGKTAAGGLNGALDEVRVYKRSLSALEINNLIQSSAIQSNTKTTPIVALDKDFTLAARTLITRTPPTNADGLFRGGAADLNFYGGAPRLYNGITDAVVSNTTVSPNKWAHVAVTRSSKKLTMYLNGVQTGTGTWDGTFALDQIGSGLAGQLQGTIAAVDIETRALSSAEVKAAAGVGSNAFYVPQDSSGTCGPKTQNGACPK
ncbi:LamG domain-containing protein [Rhizobium tubonense]|uniref:LamG-like jellyroll fold domain-containing protein n=1 Tax=Rhizobium tubonense TaxID=484088 RepID=A0A2W4CS47_9HYPH|nr:hypothetical protein CPY51_16645 [Rhizobium tubonense]